jgi:hypothetical protein
MTMVGLIVVAAAGFTYRVAEPAEPTGSADQAAEIARLKDEIERLKGMVPDQSHVMKDVAYHFSNLWFAGQARNLSLAGFYLNETRAHLRRRCRPLAVDKRAENDRGARPGGLLEGVPGQHDRLLCLPPGVRETVSPTTRAECAGGKDDRLLPHHVGAVNGDRRHRTANRLNPRGTRASPAPPRATGEALSAAACCRLDRDA